MSSIQVYTSIYWPHIIICVPKSRTGQAWIYIPVYTTTHNCIHMVHVDEKRCTGRLQNMKMTWISAHMKYNIHMHVHEEKDRETHGLNLEMNRTVWKNFLSLLAAALVLKEFFVTDQEGWNRTCWEHYIHRGIKVFLKTISIWGQNVDGLWPRGGLPFRFNNQRHLAVKMHNWSFTDVNSCHFVYDGEFQSYIITNSVCSA